MKAMASDMDGTLVFDHEIHEGDLKAISRFQDAGNLFGVCTGRAYKMCLDDISKFKCDFVISSSGASIKDHNGDTLYECTVDFKDIKNIYNQYEKETILIVIQADDSGYFKGRENGQSFHDFDSINQYQDSTIFGISLVFNTDEKARVVTEKINNEYKNLLGHQNKNSIDIVNRQCSKGNAIKKLKELLNIDIIGAIGDSYNDISMLSVADQSYTFYDSPNEVKDIAGNVVHSLSEALDHFR